ncbi:MAG TPA: SdrD B-like domain-containing protein [Opitutaceae bacterium]|nr:SdrD B-like domain-containing protein [Opitutaceae bacterium]
MPSTQSVQIGNTTFNSSNTNLTGWGIDTYLYTYVPAHDTTPGANTTALYSGYIVCPGGQSAAGVRTDGANSGYADYMGFSGFGSGTYTNGPDVGKCVGGTVFLVVRPHDATWNSTTEQLFGCGSGTETSTGSGWIELYQNNGVLSLKIGCQSAASSLSLPSISWDTNSWYFIAASWREGKMSLYCRAMNSTDGQASPAALTAEGTSSATGETSPGSEPLIFGARADSNDPGSSFGSADADIAYCRVDNVYSDPVDIDLDCQLMMGPDSNGIYLDRFTRGDGTVETYYAAGSTYLTQAFTRMNSSTFDGWPYEASPNKLGDVRGWLDNYLPPLLKNLDDNAANSMMHRFAQAFFYQMDPGTGLVPSTNTSPPFQTSSLIVKVEDLLNWFPNDANLADWAQQLAAATQYYFDYSNAGTPLGLFNDIGTATGVSFDTQPSVTRADWIAYMAEGMAAIGNRTNNPDLISFGAQKIDFEYNHKSSEYPLLNQSYTTTDFYDAPNGTENDLSDTDTLYAVRSMFNYYMLTGDMTVRNYILDISNRWYTYDWMPDYNQFVRKMNLTSGSWDSAFNGKMYGDGDWNTLYFLTNMYRLSGDADYLTRFKAAYDEFIAHSPASYTDFRIDNSDPNSPKEVPVPLPLPSGALAGLAPDSLIQDVGDNINVTQNNLNGSTYSQTSFLDALLDAYEASGDKGFLTRAQQLADATFSAIDQINEYYPSQYAPSHADAALIRSGSCQGGDTFLRLANDLTPIRRLEVNFGAIGGRVVVSNSSGTILDQTLSNPASQSAVIYLPQGNYNVQLSMGNASTTVSVALNGYARVDWSVLQNNAQIYGRVFNDADGNGFFNASESGLSGWTVYLDSNNNGQLDAGEPSTLTDANGNYSFAGLMDGTYTVRFASQNGWRCTYGSTGQSATVADGARVVGCDFGLTQTAAGISGSVFVDSNGNGTKDSGEPSYAGLMAYLDSNNNAVRDAGEPLAMTDANGGYSFTNLAPGTYTVRLIAPPDWSVTGSDHHVFTLASGDGLQTNANFGIQLPAPTFSAKGGSYELPQTIAITSAASGTIIRYTTDGSTPSETNGIIYSGPVTISSTTTLKAIAYASGFGDSPVTTAVYNLIPGWAVRDFDGNGSADILWQNAGQFGIWTMSGITPISFVKLGGEPSTMTILAVGDFNHDGSPDILWRNTSNNEIGIMLMNGTTVSGYDVIGKADSSWTVAGLGDFNNNGQTDILWEHNTSNYEIDLWSMNGTSVTSVTQIGTVPSPWTIVGVGDFNNDGKPDLLWYYPPTGQLAVMLMNGTAAIGSQNLLVLPSGWTVSGVADFNGDGSPDLLVSDAATGGIGIWLMNGMTPGQVVSLGTVPAPWQPID